DVLDQVRGDMLRTIYPSFLGRAPPEVGSASAGSLSADQWRTFCLVDLPITLVRLWGVQGAPARKHALLGNFLDLVVAIKHGTARRLTPGLIHSFESRIFAYAAGLRNLFPTLDLSPNHHLALHLGEILRSFGPTHAYWAFPFERYIHLLRNVNQNYRPGE
ncbi:hypothetical protein C8Q79DRAFT_913207, partial [Trametes meyenii]